MPLLPKALVLYSYLLTWSQVSYLATSSSSNPTTTTTTATTEVRSLPRSRSSLSSSSTSSSSSRKGARGSSSSSGSTTATLSSSATPPWNPSLKIRDNGFLVDVYQRIPGEWELEYPLQVSALGRVWQWLAATSSPKEEEDLQGDDHEDSPSSANNYNDPPPAFCRVRQVPGDGNCLFHSISLCLHHAANGTHWGLDSPQRLDDLFHCSRRLRQQAVACLRDANRRLVLQGPERLCSHELVQAAAQQYGLSADEYCAAMQEDAVWGGGPEIVSLSNILERPIHVYELAVAEPKPQQQQQQQQQGVGSSNNNHRNFRGGRSSRPYFVLRRMACFGSPLYDRQQSLHILSADSRFPDISPGQQLPAGNHFLAVFPIELERRRRKRIRGGGHSKEGDSVDFILNEDVEFEQSDDVEFEQSKVEDETEKVVSWGLMNWLKRII